ncbi:JmjC domain-containing protein [Kribbella sp. CA-253562]|uniref:JmjC domain-containing protein n=1 Tax=Kribbella sp. CA-253562 TaxID=3239942 RepID=UPI003D927C5B
MSDLATLTRLDWAEFAEHYWDERPVLIRGVQPVPFVAKEVFAAAVRAQESSYDGHRAPTAQFTVERTQQGERLELLPTAADDSFERYEQRLADRLGDRGYALIVSGFHAFDRELWSREREFFAGLWAQVGLPLTGAITTMFHGNYDHSPVGVHKDRFATFMFGLRARKRMRFWAERPWREPVSTVVDYARFVPESFAVEVEPGDLLYWPAGYYHVGENCGRSPATSVNIGVPRDEHKIEYELEDLLADLDPHLLVRSGARLDRLARGITAPARVAAPDQVLAAELPDALQQALRACQEQSLDARADEVSRRRWSAGGFEPMPS